MTMETIKEQFGEGLEKAKEFIKDHRQDILVFGSGAAISLVCIRKIESNAFAKGYKDALKKTAQLRELGNEIMDIAPKGAFHTTGFTANAMGGRVDNLELVSKYLANPEISKDITGVVVVTKA